MARRKSKTMFDAINHAWMKGWQVSHAEFSPEALDAINSQLNRIEDFVPDEREFVTQLLDDVSPKYHWVTKVAYRMGALSHAVKVELGLDPPKESDETAYSIARGLKDARDGNFSRFDAEREVVEIYRGGEKVSEETYEAFWADDDEE